MLEVAGSDRWRMWLGWGGGADGGTTRVRMQHHVRSALSNDSVRVGGGGGMENFVSDGDGDGGGFRVGVVVEVVEGSRMEIRLGWRCVILEGRK